MVLGDTGSNIDKDASDSLFPFQIGYVNLAYVKRNKTLNYISCHFNVGKKYKTNM